jgi:hypothetical protein
MSADTVRFVDRTLAVVNMVLSMTVCNGKFVGAWDGVLDRVGDWLVVCVAEFEGEHIILIAVSEPPRYGNATDHVAPPSPLAQLPVAEATPLLGLKFSVEIAALCHRMEADGETDSA